MQDTKVETRDTAPPDQDQKQLAASHMLDCAHDCIVAKGETSGGRVTMLGGLYLESQGDVKALDAWYEKNLGIHMAGIEAGSEDNHSIMKWSDDKAADGGVTFWEPVDGERASKMFGSSNSDFMFSYRVDNLEKIYERLKQNAKESAEVPKPEASEKGGMSLTITDPNGHRIELWEPEQAAANKDKGSGRVVAPGGIYFRSDDVNEVNEWYENNVGLHTESRADGSRFAKLPWSEDKAAADYGGSTVWRAFGNTPPFSPSKSDFMPELRVINIENIFERLKQNGVPIVNSTTGKVDTNVKGPDCDPFGFGKFLWVLDPDGRKVELWEPHRNLACPKR